MENRPPRRKDAKGRKGAVFSCLRHDVFSLFLKKMMQHDKQHQQGEGVMPPAETGNASNPSSHEGMGPAGGNQLIHEKGEKYLREVSSPEDYPDSQDEQDRENLERGRE